MAKPNYSYEKRQRELEKKKKKEEKAQKKAAGAAGGGNSNDASGQEPADTADTSEGEAPEA